ncbi:type IV pilus assembly protein PilM [Patescibacteria group bacterium]|nr:type IV pilus assembly protein PilM [Patescibacteria group bacterium]MBU4023103.1 type IV pilus assembly protein PilM [Patescibacteria group bacterium]MBU4078347.1 type IV pilus assembly protein PilM [Patescibacteria group bacterium]
MFDILNLNPGSFGLDISDRTLKLVQIKEGKQGLNISALNQVSMPSGIIRRGEIKDIEKLSLYIKKIVSKTSKLTSRYVVASLPEEKSFLHAIQMPKMSDIDLKKAVRFEAENYIPFSLDKVYLDSEIITYPKPKGDSVEVLITAMLKKIVDPYIKAIKKAGLIPLAMETESNAAARALIKDGIAEEQVYLIDFGATSTSFSVYYGNCLRFASFIPVSSEDFTLAIAKAIGKDREEAEVLKKLHGLKNKGITGKRVAKAIGPCVDELAAEIKKHIEYYESRPKSNGLKERKEKINKLLFYGGGAELNYLSEALSKELKLEIEKANSIINLSKESKNIFSKRKHKPFAFTVAIGLALREFYD